MNNWNGHNEIILEEIKKELYFCIFLGWAGAHKFLQHRIGMGILYLFTFGLFGIGWLVDCFKLALEYREEKNNKSGRSKREVLEYAKKLDQKSLQQNIIRQNLKEKCCPYCGGFRYHAFVENKVIRAGKVKSQIVRNVNPFKPFTVYNHEEKVIREPVTMQVSKFVCDDCGTIFK